MAARTATAYSPQKAQRELEDLQLVLRAANGDGEAMDSLTRIASEVLPKGSSTALAGESRELEESGSSLYFAFLLALLGSMAAYTCLLYTSPSPRDGATSRMPSSA